MTNPLIQKYYEIYPEKKEESKKVEYELTPEFYEELKKLNSTNISVASNLTTPSVATSNTGITKASPIKCFDNESLTDAFLQIAEKVKNGTAQVYSMNMDMDYSYRTKRITFEVWDNL